MLQPEALASTAPYGPWSCRGSDVWETLCAATAGDLPALRTLLERDPDLRRAAYWYTQPIHLAVREGRTEAVRLLLAAGADPQAPGPGDDLATVARDRGHEEIARLLEAARKRRGRVAAEASDHPIHAAASAGDAARARALLDAEPGLVGRGDRSGATALHRAAAAGAREAIVLLLERGADVHALHGTGAASGYAPIDFQPVDLALWSGPFWNLRGDLDTARLLVAGGADRDLVVASALGDLDQVREILDADPRRIDETRPCGKRALSTAVELGHREVVRLLLERGADPNASEGATAPRGVALHAAARAGDRPLVELLLAHGADPNGAVDSSGSATYAAATAELRELLVEHGGRLDAGDLVWLGEDDRAVQRIAAADVTPGEGGTALAAACKLGKRDLVVRLLAAGARVPPVFTECRSYLLSDPETLGVLLAHGMDPNLPDWQRATPLHDLCDRDGRGRPRPHRTACAALLAAAGAELSARDDGYRSTPLAWAARNDLPDMVEWLLARGAPVHLPDDEPWAIPRAWAQRRGNERCAELLRAQRGGRA